MPFINFRNLPTSAGGLSKLFNDYLYDFPKVKQFYPSDFHALENVRLQFEKTQKGAEHRSVLVEILKEQNTSFGCSEKSLRNVELLRDEKTFCVVTGQQVGVLGGPLYTFYKSVTAVKLAERLKKKYPEFNFIPVFWLEGEDHDFAEANNITLLTQENVPVKIEYLIDGKPSEKNIGPVGEIAFDDSLTSFLLQVGNTLPNSEFHSRLLTLLDSSYNKNRSFNMAFARWLWTISRNGEENGNGDSGLVFISSNDKRIKHILSPVFLKELQDCPQTSRLVINQSAQLEKEYHAQIKPKALNLFLLYKGGRYLVEPRDGQFSLKGIRHYPTKDDLLRIATETPELLSPNVVLRAICQDVLLPTVAYVAGPSEVAYYAQLKPVYEYYAVPMPIIYPRASATILEQKLQVVLEKYQLKLLDFFGNRERLNARVISILSEVDLNQIFSSAEKSIEEILNEMKFGLNYIDSTLVGSLENTHSKIKSQLLSLNQKAGAAQQRKHEIALRQVDKVLNSVFPNGNFQERELNILHFMNKYGLDFPKRLYNELQIDAFEHQVIEL